MYQTRLNGFEEVCYTFCKSDLLTYCTGGLAGSQYLEGGCWERGGTFFEQGEVGIAVFT